MLGGFYYGQGYAGQAPSILHKVRRYFAALVLLLKHTRSV
jgi:hypothetical protein